MFFRTISIAFILLIPQCESLRRVPSGERLISNDKRLLPIGDKIYEAIRLGEEPEAAELLVIYRPDYFVSGHDHAFPYKSDQSWNQTLGEVCVLVPGQLMSAPFPNHIKLDTESGENSWHTIRQIWMPEDERFEYLLLKFAKE